MTRFPCNCNKRGRMSSTMRRFSEVVDELDLNGQSMSRLGPFLVIED